MNGAVRDENDRASLNHAPHKINLGEHLAMICSSREEVAPTPVRNCPIP
ncbi:hypothetical protein [Laspinema palackyanum]